MAGLMDIALHPQFDEEQVDLHLVPQADGPRRRSGQPRGDIASNSILRGTWDGKGLTDIKDIFVADDVDMEVSRLAFGADGMLYMSIGGPGTGGDDSVIRPQHTNDYAGKILRMRDDGSVPPDNPFVGKTDYKERIFSMGHRNQLGMALNPWTKEIWSGEQGPNGGDEINIIRAGKNYGWPLVSDGRDYRGPYISPSPFKEGMERPHVVFVPSIAISSIAFYTGDRFPNWQRNLFVSGMREGEIARTGQLVRIVFNDNWEEMRRESLLRDLHQRIRDVRQGPDGLLYVITDEGAELGAAQDRAGEPDGNEQRTNSSRFWVLASRYVSSSEVRSASVRVRSWLGQFWVARSRSTTVASSDVSVLPDQSSDVISTLHRHFGHRVVPNRSGGARQHRARRSGPAGGHADRLGQVARLSAARRSCCPASRSSCRRSSR